jgi:hypothetical protein
MALSAKGFSTQATGGNNTVKATTVLGSGGDVLLTHDQNKSVRITDSSTSANPTLNIISATDVHTITSIGGEVTDGFNSLNYNFGSVALASGTSGTSMSASSLQVFNDAKSVIIDGTSPNIIITDGTNTSSIFAGSMTVTLPPTADDQVTRKDYVDSVAIPAITVQAASGTIALTPAMNRSTYILTGTTATQTFNPAGLAGQPAGFCVYLRNGNNATGTGQDISIGITGVVGTVFLHTITTTTNSGGMLLYWNGSVLTRYR